MRSMPAARTARAIASGSSSADEARRGAPGAGRRTRRAARRARRSRAQARRRAADAVAARRRAGARRARRRARRRRAVASGSAGRHASARRDGHSPRRRAGDRLAGSPHARRRARRADLSHRPPSRNVVPMMPARCGETRPLGPRPARARGARPLRLASTAGGRRARGRRSAAGPGPPRGGRRPPGRRRRPARWHPPCHPPNRSIRDHLRSGIGGVRRDLSGISACGASTTARRASAAVRRRAGARSAGLRDPEREDRDAVDERAGGQADADRHDLADETAPERVVERLPDAVGDGGQQRRRGGHLRDGDRASGAPRGGRAARAAGSALGERHRR